MINPPSTDHDDEDALPATLHPTSSRNETQPLLDPGQTLGQSSASTVHPYRDTEADEDANRSPGVRQIFSAKLFAVMFCFLLNGLYTTAVGVSSNTSHLKGVRD